jgi:hypothetical protein
MHNVRLWAVPVGASCDGQEAVSSSGSVASPALRTRKCALLLKFE